MIQAGVRSPADIIQMVLEEENVQNAGMIAGKIELRLAVALASISEKPFKDYNTPGTYILIGLENKANLEWITYDTNAN